MSDKVLFSSALDQVTTTRLDVLGSLRWVEGKLYKYVAIKNISATVAGVAGFAVAYLKETGVESHTVTMKLSDADSPPVPAGLLMAAVAGVHTPAPVTYYGWIQVTGAATASEALGGSAGDGHPLGLISTDGTLVRLNEADSAAVYKTVCAVANKASTKKIICKFPF